MSTERDRLPDAERQGQRAAFEQLGFVRLPEFFGRDAIDALRAEVDRALGGTHARNAYGILRPNIWQSSAPFRDLLLGGELARVARELLMVPEIVLFQDVLVWKPPGTEGRVQWHQDFAYWPLSSPSGITLWLAIDAADPGNGCLHYIPRTHQEGERAPTDFVSGSRQPLRSDLPPLDAASREAEAVPVCVSPGDLIAHHPLIWHMSPGNPSSRHRRALSMTWITPDCVWDPAHAPHPYNFTLSPRRGTLLEGEPFPHFPRPA